MKKIIIYFVFLILAVHSIPFKKIIKRELQETLSDDIVIIHTNDVHCGVQDKIGYDGLMLYKKYLQTKYKHVLLVDAGDHIQGGTIGLITNGEAIIDIMNKVGYDAVTLGNHEFDYGIEQLETCASKLNAGYVSANFCFRKNKTVIYPPYKIVEAGSKKIAFIGVATPQTLTKTSLITKLEDDSKPIYHFMTDDNSQELYKEIQKHIDEIKDNNKADYIIILAHLGYGGDALEENSSPGLLHNLKGVNALIDGHTHLVYTYHTPDKEGKNVLYAQTGTKLQYMGILTIGTNGEITQVNVNETIEEISKVAPSLNFTRSKNNVWVDKEISEYIDSIYANFSDILNTVIGRTDFPLNIFRYGESKESSDQMSRSAENGFCNLVTDAMRYFGEADVTIMNAGSVREDIEAGNITYQQVINTMPFSNDVLVKNISGQDILNALEFGVKTLPGITSRFPQVSGISYKINMNLNSTVEVDENENFLRVKGQRRVYDVKVNGAPISPNKYYSIASNSFILGGGDGYTMFTKAQELKTAVGVDNEVLLKYINKTLNGTVPTDYSQTGSRIIKTYGDIGNTKEIKIIHTNDVHCGVQDSIGYDGLMYFKKKLQAQYQNVLLVDAGDHIQGGTMGLITNGMAIIDIMNKVGYDVATLGNHEFDYQIPQLETCAAALKCGYISCNFCFNKNKTNVYNPYKIIEIGGKKIGFIGVATPQTLSKTYLITVKDDNDELVYDFLTDNHSQELFDRVQAHINHLRNNENVNYIIIVAHLGVDGDAEEENTSAGLLKRLKNVDALIDGHTHLVYSRTTPDKTGKLVPFAQEGTKLTNVGVFTIHENGTFTHEDIENITYDEILKTEAYNVTRNKKEQFVDINMYVYIKSIEDSFSDILNQVVGHTDFPLNVYKNAQESKQSHEQMSRTSENTLCNLVTDAMRHFGEADVTIMNAGSVREDINEGDITYQEVINTMPFSNDVLVKNITGQDILDALEYGVRILPDSTSRFPQVSGLSYKIDMSINSSVVIDKDEVFVSVGGPRRVYDVKLEDGSDVDPSKYYTISSNSFILGGGDGYSMFTNAEIIKTAIGVDNEILLKYINNTLEGVIPDRYSKKEDRIVKTIGKTKKKDIKIIHTNDVHCGVQDAIGYDGLMLFKKQLMTRYDDVILVDAGDHIQGGTMGLITNGEAIIDIMNKIGYDVVTLGNHEFDYGIAQLEVCKNLLNSSYISCNYCKRSDKKAIYDPYKIVTTKNGKKIGFIGVATIQTLSKTYLITLLDSNGEPIYDFLTDNHSQELFSRVQQHINYLRNTAKVDYVIILAHLGVDGDAEEENTSAGLLKNIENVDALIDGHTHLVYSRTTPDKNGKLVPFAQTGTKLNYIGVFTIFEIGTFAHENIEEVPYDSILDAESYNVTRSKRERWVDINMYEYIRSKFNSFSDVLNQVVGHTNFPLNVYAIGTVDKQSHDQLSRTSENAFCNLVTDALRHAGNADVTIMNAGSVREDIEAGNITYQQVINTMPFSNDVIVKRITGQTILDALEHGVRTLPASTSRFPQVSGITYKIDLSIESPVKVDASEIFERIEGERRVYDVLVNGEEVDPNKYYTISSNSFILGGGDGYSMFTSYEIIDTSAGVDNEVLLNYINITLDKEIPERYKKAEGRIIKTNGKTSSNDIVILHTNDVHCGVQDAIGYDGLMLYKKQLLTKYKNVILVDAGDHIQGGTMGTITNGLAIIEIMNKLEYDVVTLGNHEFDYGVAQLEECEKLLKCSYISTNYCYHKNKTAIYPAYKIIERGGKKIAFVGVATPQTLSKTSLITVKDENGETVYDFLTENHSKELHDRVQDQINKAKQEGADYVIILAHLGVDGDAEEENTSAGLLKRLQKVDALIDGHTHLVYNRTTPDKTGKLVPFAQTGTKLNNIGVTIIHEDGTITQENVNKVIFDGIVEDDALKITRDKEDIYVDKEMYEFIVNMTNSYSDILNRVIGKTNFILNVYQIGVPQQSSHDQISRFEENAFCNLVTDALRYFGDADVTIMNAGSVRKDIEEGNITYQQIIDTMPFSNDVLVKQITGQQLLDALEFGVRTLPGFTSRFPQVSGIKYCIDTSISSSVIVDSAEIFVRVGGKRRVYNVTVNGVKLDLLKKYTISSNSFILGGGDGYSMFADAEIVKTAVGVDNEVLLKYISETLKGVVPDKYKEAEGRIVKTNGKKIVLSDEDDGFFMNFSNKFVLLLILLLL